MKFKLGYIVVEEEVINSDFFNNKNTNIVNIVNTYIDSDLPTLIIGWEQVKSIFEDNVSILNKRIKKNLFWTFSPSEKYQASSEDVDKFILELYNDFIKNYTYEVIDPFIDQIKSIDNIMRFMDYGICEYTYITDDFIYVYNPKSKNIIGIDLNYFKSVGFNIDKIIDGIKCKSNKIIVEDYSENGVYQKYKNSLKVDFEKKYIPVFESQIS